MKYDFKVNPKKKIRLIISSDTKNEADDQYAIAHALMSPKIIVKGIVASHFEYSMKEGSMEASYDEIQKVVSLMGLEESVDILKGSGGAIVNESTPVKSEGAEYIVKEALKEDDIPLFIICIGALTDLACAYLMNPKIAERMTAIWVGGGAYPKGYPEFNLRNDIHAANVVFKSDIPLWQVPLDVCSILKASIAELQYKVKPCGRIGLYLFKQLCEVNRHDRESWIFWDSAAVGLVLDDHWHKSEMISAHCFNKDMEYIPAPGMRDIRVYKYIDSRFIFGDFFSKLAINYGE